MYIGLEEMLSFHALIASSVLRQTIVASNTMFSRPPDKKGYPPGVAEQLRNATPRNYYQFSRKAQPKEVENEDYYKVGI